MKNLACGLMIFSMAALFDCTTPSSTVLDGTYDSAIERSVKALDQSEKREYLGDALLESTRAWKKQPSYTKVREEVGSLRGIRNQFRLEVGNVNAGGYGVIWIVETDSGIDIFSNIFSARHLISGRLSQAQWDQFLHQLARHDKAATCKPDLSVDDGSTYYGTIALDHHIKEFIVYGFVPFPPTPLATGLYAQLAPCSDIILAAYSLAKSIHK